MLCWRHLFTRVLQIPSHHKATWRSNRPGDITPFWHDLDAALEAFIHLASTDSISSQSNVEPKQVGRYSPFSHCDGRGELLGRAGGPAENVLEIQSFQGTQNQVQVDA